MNVLIILRKIDEFDLHEEAVEFFSVEQESEYIELHDYELSLNKTRKKVFVFYL